MDSQSNTDNEMDMDEIEQLSMSDDASSVQEETEQQETFMPFIEEDKEPIAIDNQFMNIGKDRVTPDTLTRFEVARLIGVRARIIEITG